MAGEVIERYQWDERVVEADGGAAIQNAKVWVWDSTQTRVVSGLLTDANGDITQQKLLEQILQINPTPPPTAIARTPHRVMAVKYVGTDAFAPNSFEKTVNGDSADVSRLDDAVLININKTIVDAYTGITITHGSTLVEFDPTAAGDPIINNSELYHRLFAENVDNPQRNLPLGIMERVDNNNFTFETSRYDVKITGGLFQGQGKAWLFVPGDGVILESGGNITNLTPSNLTFNAGTAGQSIVQCAVPGTVTFAAAGTYTFDNGGDLGNLVNTSGGAVTVDLRNGQTVTTNSGPNITVLNNKRVQLNAKDAVTGAPIAGARGYLERVSDQSVVLNTVSDGAGRIFITNFNYGAGPDVDVVGRVRRSTTTPLYKTAPVSGTITENGLELDVFLVRDD